MCPKWDVNQRRKLKLRFQNVIQRNRQKLDFKYDFWKAWNPMLRPSWNNWSNIMALTLKWRFKQNTFNRVKGGVKSFDERSERFWSWLVSSYWTVAEKFYSNWVIYSKSVVTIEHKWGRGWFKI